jgi:hypothetical protein
MSRRGCTRKSEYRKDGGWQYYRLCEDSFKITGSGTEFGEFEGFEGWHLLEEMCPYALQLQSMVDKAISEDCRASK